MEPRDSVPHLSALQHTVNTKQQTPVRRQLPDNEASRGIGGGVRVRGECDFLLTVTRQNTNTAVTSAHLD